MNKNLDYYMSLNYKIEVLKAEENNGFVLHCPELSGCITYADTIQKGFEMIEDAKRCWFEACIEDDIKIPEPNNLSDYIDQVKLPKMFALDNITNVYNKKVLLALLQNEIKNAQKQNKRINVALIDIDLLILVNHTYGHQIGDEYLFKIATIIKDNLMLNNTIIGRTSGDEFIIIFLNTSVDIVINECIKIQKAIEEAKLLNGLSDDNLYVTKRLCGRKFVTVSIGIVSKIPSKNETCKFLMNQLDEILYSGKKNGYNSIEVFKS